MEPPLYFVHISDTHIEPTAVYLLWMFQSVFMGPLDKEENKKLRDVNGRELAIFLVFLVFIVWIGVGPSVYFGLMDTTVADLVTNFGGTVAAMH